MQRLGKPHLLKIYPAVGGTTRDGHNLVYRSVSTWERDVFALSVAVQTLLYGAAQPFSGAIADRFGTIPVIIVGALLYAAGIFMMAHASSPAMRPA